MKKEEFNKMSTIVLDVMEKKARELNIEGVAVVCNLEDGKGNDWQTALRVVDKIRTEVQPDQSGYNFIGVVYAKVAEMMDTKQNSGSKTRPILVGELGYKGGEIRKDGEGYVVTAFSGGPSAKDLLVSQAGQNSL